MQNKFWRAWIPATAAVALFMGEPAMAAWKAPNTAPTISGSPPTSVQAGTTYVFTPSASDAQRDRLRFSISNKPAWASFSSSSGRLSGTPKSSQAGIYRNIVIRVSDGKLSASLPAFSITVLSSAPAPTPTPTPTNTAPTISGTPATTVDAGKAYSFVPKASDANGDALGFSIANRPAWSTFNVATGALTGTPTTAQAGTYSNISISVSDGKTTASLAPFSITVRQPVVTGSANLSWTPPTQNTDGSPLTNLAGYKIYHGTSAGALTDVINISGSSITSYAFNNLVAGTHYFAVSAYTSTGAESARSGVGSKTIQ